MKVELISIGDELLIGQTVNTNASWMGQQLSLIGADVVHGSVIKDQREVLLQAFSDALDRADVVLVTGGLGPTQDDITKSVLCEFFNTELEQNDAVLAHVKSFFVQRKRPILDVNIAQAMVPKAAKVLHNAHGTAPGMWFEKGGKVLVSMPGVPYEMKAIMTESVLPAFLERFDLDSLYHWTIQTQGIGESTIADRIAVIETQMRKNGVSLAYLPSPGGVRLRLSAPSTDEFKKAIAEYSDQISHMMPQYVFGYNNAKLEEVVGELLIKQGLKLGTVESCTGGAVAAAITSISGASTYFEGSVVSYSNDIKMGVVGVQQSTLETYGAVSQQTVEEMAIGGNKQLNTDYCVALSGIAGPDGGTDEKPVGTVWIGVAGPERVISKKFLFEKDRNRNIRRSVLTALNLLRCELLKINIEKS